MNTCTDTTATAGVFVYRKLSERIPSGVPLGAATSRITVAADGRSVTATWRLTHRLRLTRTVAYDRSAGTGAITITNRLITSSGKTAGLNRSPRVPVGRYNRTNFAEVAAIQFLGAARDPRIEGLRALAANLGDFDAAAVTAA
jgi:hypothetical protein